MAFCHLYSLGSNPIRFRSTDGRGNRLINRANAIVAVCQACWHALDDLSVDSVEAGRATMGLESKAKAAQLSVLSKYGVLADFTDVEEVVLDRALKGRLSASASKELTFAHWCDQLLGLGVRLPVARFAGQGRDQRIETIAAHLQHASFRQFRIARDRKSVV